MATFLFLVCLTATTVLMLAIAADEVVRVTRALFSQAYHSTATDATAKTPVHAAPPAQLRQFPQRGRFAPNADDAAELDSERAA